MRFWYIPTQSERSGHDESDQRVELYWVDFGPASLKLRLLVASASRFAHFFIALSMDFFMLSESAPCRGGSS